MKRPDIIWEFQKFLKKNALTMPLDFKEALEEAIELMRHDRDHMKVQHKAIKEKRERIEELKAQLQSEKEKCLSEK